MDNTEKACVLIILALATKHKIQRKKWVKKWILKRQFLSHCNLVREIQLSEAGDYKNYFRMSDENYSYLLKLVTPLIKKKSTHLRTTISPNERLAVTLRFLATGRNFADLKYSAVMGESTIGQIVMETCRAINVVLRNYIQIPQNNEEWRKVAKDFGQKWNFFNCLGAIDGKHVAIRKPPNSGSLYYNYKKFFSIVLMPVVNANYEFIMIDIGSNGRVSDGGVIFYTKFWQLFINNSLDIPEEKFLPASEYKLPFVFIGDDAFSMTENLLKPYSQQNLSEEKRIFNYRLSRARRVVENAFGILPSRFQVFEKPMRLSPEKATLVTMTCCYLHNFLIKHNKRQYASKSVISYEDIQEGNIVSGQDRVVLEPLRNSKSHNNYEAAKKIRDKYSEYFNTIGQVPWQKNFL